MKQKLQNIHQKHKWLKYVYVICAFTVVAFYYGARNLTDVNFIVTNGDFQTYNVLNRFLHGQIPYVDFANYLGGAPLITLTPFLLFNNNFLTSLFATNFVSAMFFMLFVWLLTYIFVKNYWVASIVALAMPVLNSSKLLLTFVPYYGYYVTMYLDLLMYPGNSIRILRLGLVLILAMVLLIYIKKKPNAKLQESVNSKRFLAVCAYIVGACIVWSNDFGISVIVSSTFLVFCFLLNNCIFAKMFGGFKLFEKFAMWVLFVVLGVFSGVLLITRGHPLAWIKDTVQIGSWQYWFFTSEEQEKITNFIQFFTANGDSKHERVIFHLVIFALFFIWFFYSLIKNKLSNYTIVYMFIALSIVVAFLAYMYGSGGFEFEEGIFGLLILTLAALLIKFIMHMFLKYVPKIKNKNSVRLINAMCAICILIFLIPISTSAHNEFSKRTSIDVQNSDYIAELNGATYYAFALRQMEDIVGDNKIFSTYSSALDLMLGQFQPTGSDYIIHALGEEVSTQYLNEFKNGEYPYVQTTNFKTWVWEHPTSSVQKNSWQFYSELYENYSVQGYYADWVLWERNESGIKNIAEANNEIEVVKMDEKNVVIRIESDTEFENAIASVNISYETSRNLSWFTFQTFKTTTYVRNSSFEEHFKGYFMPNEAENRQIMVPLENGKAEITISSLPREGTVLNVKDASVSQSVHYINHTEDGVVSFD